MLLSTDRYDRNGMRKQLVYSVVHGRYALFPMRAMIAFENLKNGTTIVPSGRLLQRRFWV
jgi:hypothetical protein